MRDRGKEIAVYTDIAEDLAYVVSDILHSVWLRPAFQEWKKRCEEHMENGGDRPPSSEFAIDRWWSLSFNFNVEEPVLFIHLSLGTSQSICIGSVEVADEAKRSRDHS